MLRLSNILCTKFFLYYHLIILKYYPTQYIKKDGIAQSYKLMIVIAMCKLTLNTLEPTSNNRVQTLPMTPLLWLRAEGRAVAITDWVMSSIVY
jgi:hypothetical protein